MRIRYRVKPGNIRIRHIVLPKEHHNIALRRRHINAAVRPSGSTAASELCSPMCCPARTNPPPSTATQILWEKAAKKGTAPNVAKDPRAILCSQPGIFSSLIRSSYISGEYNPIEFFAAQVNNAQYATSLYKCHPSLRRMVRIQRNSRADPGPAFPCRGLRPRPAGRAIAAIGQAELSLSEQTNDRLIFGPRVGTA